MKAKKNNIFFPKIKDQEFPKRSKTPLKSLSTYPLVSIITTCYNSVKYIEECLQSVLAQDYPFIEHVIQDGGSTDGTLKIIKKYARKYKNIIKWRSEKDKGQSDGLNKALQRTKGDIILVLNADDCLMPYACSWAVENLKKYPKVGAIYGDCYIIDEKGEIIDIYKSKDFDFEKVLCVELVPPAQAAFIRRSALEKVGFWVDKDLDTCPDYEMWIRLIQKFPLKHVFGVVTKYRHYKNLQPDSKLPRTTERFVKAKRQVLDRLFNCPDINSKVKKLKNRAYASLDLWASETAFNARKPKEGVFYLLRSFLRRPTYSTLLRIIQVAKLFIYLIFCRIRLFFQNKK